MRCSTSRPERHTSVVVLLALLLGGCAVLGSPARLKIAAARLVAHGDTARLGLDCRWQPSAAMLDALDHGIALVLRVTVTAEGEPRFGLLRPSLATREHRIELRYFPLTRQYQLRDLDGGRMQSFAVRAAALAALENLDFTLDAWPAAARNRIAVEFDATALPGALRLPSLVQSGWRQAVAEHLMAEPAG